MILVYKFLGLQKIRIFSVVLLSLFPFSLERAFGNTCKVSVCMGAYNKLIEEGTSGPDSSLFIRVTEERRVNSQQSRDFASKVISFIESCDCAYSDASVRSRMPPELAVTLKQQVADFDGVRANEERRAAEIQRECPIFDSCREEAKAALAPLGYYDSSGITEGEVQSMEGFAAKCDCFINLSGSRPGFDEFIMKVKEQHAAAKKLKDDEILHKKREAEIEKASKLKQARRQEKKNSLECRTAQSAINYCGHARLIQHLSDSIKRERAVGAESGYENAGYIHTTTRKKIILEEQLKVLSDEYRKVSGKAPGLHVCKSDEAEYQKACPAE